MKHEEFDKVLASAEPYCPEDLPDVSLIRLLANPELYIDKLVRVRGFLVLEFEGTALYLHREDCEQMLLGNALWIDVTPEIWERKDELTERYVNAMGIFRGDCRAHMNLFGGAITQIQEIRTVPSRMQIKEFLARERVKQ